ncbi:MAG: hypothetical protein BJ554DRAFT_6926, partial [Olpidium bornovanus]
MEQEPLNPRAEVESNRYRNPACGDASRKTEMVISAPLRQEFQPSLSPREGRLRAFTGCPPKPAAERYRMRVIPDQGPAQTVGIDVGALAGDSDQEAACYIMNRVFRKFGIIGADRYRYKLFESSRGEGGWV